ncbi:uncharacterized protein PGTG_05137 [Puccinia graminis f. sp. tritici CRL 75-36-700-3]|uniref:Uncharacterized protein n=1 Tax=Puccinia graminis f. sp. tritici (strain CRL 75-36-700-3 / race SCCL) TaxID=418459 RepID=E3K6R2_PUCGT|nr:uncharacterized protein PGTG_05137 [Puccinia graminis f. sp. tritici CRL 75-36-700-3]EFP79912.1 hypothetical protein PGTG_05137 [Puccinia graminis f. sp. tritici CRL 75-36-700-3]
MFEKWWVFRSGIQNKQPLFTVYPLYKPQRPGGIPPILQGCGVSKARRLPVFETVQASKTGRKPPGFQGLVVPIAVPGYHMPLCPKTDTQHHLAGAGSTCQVLPST